MTTNSWTNFLAFGSILDPNDQLETRIENDISGNPLYVGKSKSVGASTSEKIWYIKKIQYDGNGFVNYVQLPVNGIGFLYSWDSRSTYF